VSAGRWQAASITAAGETGQALSKSRRRRGRTGSMKFLARCVTGLPVGPRIRLVRRPADRYCTEFKYATRSDICCGLLNRGQVIFACRMRVNICGPCFHSAETIVISE
jgi:hypothetical protein